jgi:ubiquinone/menaquinone biosynthesis C-methylase UbiE
VDGSHNSPDAGVPQREVAGLYDRLAKVYDIWSALTESKARRRALDLGEIRDGEKILEVAVGTGVAFLEIVRRNGHGLNIGIDLSRNMLLRANGRLNKLSGTHSILVLGTAFSLPLKGASIDLLMNSYMFDLIPFDDMAAVLSEFRRVLKEGGRMVLVNGTIGQSRASRLYDLVYRLSPRLIGGCRGVRLSDRLRDNGFTVETREYHQQVLFPSEVIVARR